jgi:hypothetical protein
LRAHFLAGRVTKQRRIPQLHGLVTALNLQSRGSVDGYVDLSEAHRIQAIGFRSLASMASDPVVMRELDRLARYHERLTGDNPERPCRDASMKSSDE